MKVVVNARFLVDAPNTGRGRFLNGVMSHIVGRADFDLFFVVPSGSKLLSRFDVAVVEVPRSGKPEKWDREFTLFEEIKKISPDVVYQPYFNPPDTDFPLVMTVHDFIHLHFWKPSKFFKFGCPFKMLSGNSLVSLMVDSKRLKKAKVLTAVSKTVLREVKRRSGFDDDRLFLTENAVPENFAEVSPEVESIELKKVESIKPFILSAGGMIYRKNIGRVVKAFERVRKKFGKLNLVLTGDGYWFNKLGRKKLKGVVLVGRVSSDVLKVYYKHSLLTVYASLDEGFGIPILESFAFGKPIVVSDIEVHREVGQDAVFYFKPSSVKDLERAFLKVMENPDEVKRKVEKGKKILSHYSWDRSAEELAKAFWRAG